MRIPARRMWGDLERWWGGFGLRRRPWFTPAALFVLTFSVFHGSKIDQFGDSYYSMLVSENLLRRGSFALDEYFAGPLTARRHPGSERGKLPYQITRINEHLYYGYPPGTSILSIPFVAAFNAFGVSTIAGDGGYDKRGERKIQKFTAAFLTAAFAVLVYATCRLLLPESWSVLLCLVTAFGTQAWSTASRALWSHTWVILLVGLVVHQLLAHETGRGRLRPLWLATLLVLAFCVRPTALLSLAGVGLYLVFRQRQAIVPFAAALAVWLLPFVAYAWIHFGSALPGYYLQPLTRSFSIPPAFWSVLAANLVSPARGLFIFVPQLLVVAYLLVRYREALRHRALVWLALGVIAVHWPVVSRYGWWAGFCFGPRYMTDVLPWLALLAIVAVRAWLDGRSDERTGPRLAGVPIAPAFAALLVAFGIATNGGGALTKGAERWNQYPYSLLRNPWRIWDWKDPQVLAWTRNRPKVSLPPPGQRRTAEPQQ